MEDVKTLVVLMEEQQGQIRALTGKMSTLEDVTTVGVLQAVQQQIANYSIMMNSLYLHNMQVRKYEVIRCQHWHMIYQDNG